MIITTMIIIAINTTIAIEMKITTITLFTTVAIPSNVLYERSFAFQHAVTWSSLLAGNRRVIFKLPSFIITVRQMEGKKMFGI